MKTMINNFVTMNRNVFRYSMLSLLAFVIAGCEGFSERYDIERVRGGYYEELQQLSIGEAFDSWSLCSDRKWTLHVTPRGEKHVVFYCSVLPSTLLNVIKFYTPRNEPLKGDEPYIQIKAAEFQVNWLLNNDDTFTSGQGILTVKWQDGKQDQTVVPLYPLVLQDVYSDNYNYSTAAFGQSARTFYKNAKVASD